MPHGFSAFPHSSKFLNSYPSCQLTSPLAFPNDMPPTLFHPASPKIKPAKPAKDVETSSIATTSTFSSTVGLIKNSVKSKLPISYKEYRARKDAEKASTVVTEGSQGDA